MGLLQEEKWWLRDQRNLVSKSMSLFQFCFYFYIEILSCYYAKQKGKRFIFNTLLYFIFNMIPEDGFAFDFDPQIFGDALESAKQTPNKSKKVNKKEAYSRAISKCPESPYKCKNHDSVNLRLRTFQKKNVPTCKSCGIKLEGSAGYLTCPKSENCFSICSICRICPQMHILRNVASLSIINKEKYGDNKFKCNNCSKTKCISSQKGVMYCHPCDYNICIECIEKFDQEWEKQAEEEI